MHLVDLALHLRPIYYNDCPQIRIGVNGNVMPWELTQDQVFKFKFYADTASYVEVEFLNKQPNDTVMSQGLDKAVVIESVSFFGITDPKFAWAGVYQPHDRPAMSPHTYLSWNGVWRLDFSIPVFSWMHRTQNLGWIYQ